MIDLHCDTASRLYYEGGKLKENKFSVDINKLREGGAKAQVFAHFIDTGKCKSIYDEFKKMNANITKEFAENKNDICIIKSVDELNNVNNEGKIGALLAIEEGEVLEGDIRRVEEVYNLGFRIVTLTWNYPNKIGYPNVDFIYKDNGLTEKGKEIVSKMNEVGIIPDVSHLSDRGFYDVLRISSKPFIASHSNSRAVTNHPRNLTDDMIRRLSEAGGVMGLNYCSDFLGYSSIGRIEDMIRHIKHIKQVGGIEVIALGSDFDGISNEVEINNIGKIGLLRDNLKREGFKEREIDMIFEKNVLRVLNDVLK